MTSSEILGALTTALLLGILIGWLWRRLGEKRRLGTLLANQGSPQAAELEGQLARLRAELEDADGRSNEQVVQLEEQVAVAAAEVTLLHQTLHAREEEITHLHAELVRRKATPEPAVPAPRPTPSAVEKPSTADPRDDLKAIFGVGPVLERLLNNAGVTTYQQIALWTARDIEEITGKLSVFPDRIERDNWVQGAKDEHYRKYGERI